MKQDRLTYSAPPTLHVLNIYFQECEPGDIFKAESNTCETCPQGTYSLEDPKKVGLLTCSKCDESKAICLGANKIAPLPGFWRYNTSSTNIIECPNKDACLGGYVNGTYYEHGKCAYPYEGNLCSQCQGNFAKFGSSEECTNCTTYVLYYIKFVVFFALKCIIMLVGIALGIDKLKRYERLANSDSKRLKEQIQFSEFRTNLIKISVIFVQIMTIVKSYQFKWPELVSDLFDISSKILPTMKDGLAIDCFMLALVKEKSDLYFIRFVVILLEPFSIWICFTVCYCLHTIAKKKSIKENANFKQNIWILFLIIGYMEQPQIVQACLEIFDCQNLSTNESPVYFMVQEPQVQCWTTSHLFWSLGVQVTGWAPAPRR